MLSNKISRLLIIINLLSENSDGLSKKEIMDNIELKFELSNEAFNYLDLAFKRDLESIRNDLKIDIDYNRKENLYKLGPISVKDTRLELLLNSFKIFTVLMNHSGLPEYIIPEKRKSNGLKNISVIAEAIGLKKYIGFDYFKYDLNISESKKIKLYALKESKNRWYVIGSYENSSDFRAFGLDRISNLLNLSQSFKTKINIETINKYYENSFAMFTNEKVETVKISFDLRDGNYIKSYPIHSSQICELNAEKNRYIITLNIQITLDLIMELMSRAWSIEIIEPLHLKQQLATIFEEAVTRNKSL